MGVHETNRGKLILRHFGAGRTLLKIRGGEMRRFIFGGGEIRRFVFACLVVLAALVPPLLSQAELWDPHLEDWTKDWPPGLFRLRGFISLTTLFSRRPGKGMDRYSGLAEGKGNPAFKVFAYIDGPALLWVPGCKFLGADYGLAIAQPFDYTNLRIGRASGICRYAGAQWGTFNTILVPFILSWKPPL